MDSPQRSFAVSPVLWCAVSVLLLGGAPLAMHAQTHKVARPERVTRAVGVYEWTGPINKPTAARLVPVSIFLDSQLQDAGVYLARPVPFALQSGDIYAIERAGDHLGTLDLDSARRVSSGRNVPSNVDSDDTGATAWLGYGRFMTTEAEAAAKPAKVAATPSVVVSTVADSGEDDRPHYTVRQTTPSAAADSTAPDGTKPAPRPVVDDDDDRPTLRRRDPEDAKKKRKKEGDSGVFGPKTSLNDDPDRPTMRRGAPASAIFTPALSGMPADLHQAVAVSDAANREPHEFARSWDSPAEHDQVLAAMQALARGRVKTYMSANNLQPAAAGVTAAAPAMGTSAPSPRLRGVAHPHAAKSGVTAIALDRETLQSYLLSYGGLPTFVYAAETPSNRGATVYVTLVAQRLPSGELQTALASTTDAQHLDRVPWMRPLDAVDPDASHRASLLFELRAQTNRQFGLYRLVTAQAEQQFVTGVIP